MTLGCVAAESKKFNAKYSKEDLLDLRVRDALHRKLCMLRFAMPCCAGRHAINDMRPDMQQ